MKAAETTCQKTILLVDDEPHLRDLLNDILTSQNYKVIQAVDGVDALEKFNQDPQGINLLLTDIIMPRMDGVTSAKKISSISPSVKILYMSGYISDQPHPIDNIILKPFHPDQLLQRIRAILEGGNI